LNVATALLFGCAAAQAIEISGSVIHALERRALKRAEVVMRPAQGGRARGTTTDDSGRFSFHEVPPGRYRFDISRPGFLPSKTVWQNNARLPEAVEFANDIEGLSIKLLPATTITGKVRHHDGEPAVRVGVEAWREHWARNRHAFEMARSAVTDDRGEYRLPGLPSGRYYIAAIAAPFRGNDDVDEQWVRDSSGVLRPPERPVTTFLPSAWKLSEATPMHAPPGAEIGNADIFVARERVGTINGRMTHGGNGQPIQGATIRLMRQDGSGTGFLPANHFPVRSHGRGEFTIVGVLPGSYVLEARSAEKGGVLYSRQTLTIGNSPVTTVNVLLQPEVAVAGQVTTTAREGQLPRGLRVLAEPRGEGIPGRSARVESNGTFALRLMPGEVYDVLVVDPPENVYLRSVVIGGEDVMKNGLRLSSATPVPLTLTVDMRGAQVRGITQAGANVRLVPDDGLLSRFYETTASEWGVFQFRGVAPGEYRVIAWFEEPPCDAWSQSARSECGRFGQPLKVQESGMHTLALEP
jgi:hypothetical protein